MTHSLSFALTVDCGLLTSDVAADGCGEQLQQSASNDPSPSSSPSSWSLRALSVRAAGWLAGLQRQAARGCHGNNAEQQRAIITADEEGVERLRRRDESMTTCYYQHAAEQPHQLFIISSQ